MHQNLSLTLGEGMICGLLGRNGAGKSTLLYLMMGLLRPKKGCVEVDGMRADRKQSLMLQEMFLVPEEFALPKMRLNDYLKTIRPLYPRFSDELLGRCLREFGLPENPSLGSLSMGQKKQVLICVALAAQTKYLLMDEPTNGLDILSKSIFRKVVVSGMTDDKMILISTHQVHDVEKLLDHVVILDHSRVLFDAPLVEQDEEPIDLEQLFVKTVLGDGEKNNNEPQNTLSHE